VIAQQQNNQTSSSLANQQQPIGTSFQIDNTTFSHHMAVLNDVQIYYVIGGHGDPDVIIKLLDNFFGGNTTKTIK
jgi:hypothetical protein